VSEVNFPQVKVERKAEAQLVAEHGCKWGGGDTGASLSTEVAW